MIDSHHHLWRYTPEEYPWIPPGSPLSCDRLIPELEAAIATTGIHGTIAVQARQTTAETDFLLGLSDISPLIRGVIGWLPLTSPAFPTTLEPFLDSRKLCGLRHVLQDEPDTCFSSESFHHGLSHLATTRLTYDLLIYQRQIPAAIALIDRQPSLPIVLDHIAKPEARNGQLDPTWRSGIRELARRDNLIAVKFSGLVTEFPPGEIDPSTIEAYFLDALEVFGPQRLMFGSDWPVSLLRVDSYASWLNAVRHLARHLSPTEQDAFFSQNAITAYKLSPLSDPQNR